MISIGVALSLAALVLWGFGDFLIQRTARLVGSTEALFYIGIAGAVVIFPFIYGSLDTLSAGQLLLLAVTGIAVVFGATFDFEALRQGKLAVIEPIVGLELPIAAALSILFVGERPEPVALVLITVVFLGTVLTVLRSINGHVPLKRLLERGVLLALLAALGTALTSVFVGVSSQQTTPLMAIWFANTMLAVAAGAVLLFQNRGHTAIQHLARYPLTIAGESTFNTLAWLAFAFATTMIPISIANTISGGYIALAVLLGLLVNREPVKQHQVVGILLVVTGLVGLSFIS